MHRKPMPSPNGTNLARLFLPIPERVTMAFDSKYGLDRRRAYDADPRDRTIAELLKLLAPPEMERDSETWNAYTKLSKLLERLVGDDEDMPDAADKRAARDRSQANDTASLLQRFPHFNRLGRASESSLLSMDAQRAIDDEADPKAAMQQLVEFLAGDDDEKLEQANQMLDQICESGMTQDEPPPFSGRPRPGGEVDRPSRSSIPTTSGADPERTNTGLTADERRRYAMDEATARSLEARFPGFNRLKSGY